MEINPNNRNIPASDEGRTPPPVRRAVPPASSAGDRSASEGIGRNAASHEPGASEGRRIPGTAPRADRTEAASRRTREIPSQSPERRQPMSDAQSPRRTVPRQNAARAEQEQRTVQGEQSARPITEGNARRTVPRSMPPRAAERTGNENPAAAPRSASPARPAQGADVRNANGAPRSTRPDSVNGDSRSMSSGAVGHANPAGRAATPSSSSESAEGKNVNPAEHPARRASALRPNANPRSSFADISQRPSADVDDRVSLPSTSSPRRASVLRPRTDDGETIGGTRVVPVTGAENAANGSGEKREKKKKGLSPSFRERLGAESSNAVISLIKAAIYLVCVLIVSVGISLAVIMVGNDVFAFVKSEDEIEIVIPENADLDTVADVLSSNGIIKYPSVFKWFAGYKHDDGQFLAGTYKLKPSTDYEDILASFKEKKPSGTSRITIPEGYTTDEIIDLLVEKGIGTREGYVEVINNYDFDYWFLDDLETVGYSKDRIYRLDGYLFPDTYEFYNASKPETVINKMLYRFAQVFTDDYRKMTVEKGMTVDDIVTLASMIEKEAGTSADYFKISEVFWNRLNNPAQYPRLESDATVVYQIAHELGERPKKVTAADMDRDLPYNTYIHEGLPPGPISNPSATAMLAALNPSKNGYYFFVSDGRKTYFSADIYTHNYYLNMIRSQNEESN